MCISILDRGIRVHFTIPTSPIDQKVLCVIHSIVRDVTSS